jgi:two-component system cell cycle sensor histidine kinase/response regulator CckA
MREDRGRMERMTTRPARILVADDEESVLDVTCEMLKAFGQEADGTATWTRAIELYRRSMMDDSPYDLVILGLSRPMELGADATVRELRALDPEARVVISTALGDDDLSPCQRNGIHAVLRKPYRMQDLIMTVREAIQPDFRP